MKTMGGSQSLIPAKAIRVCFVIENLKPAGTEMWTQRLIEMLDRTYVEPLLCLTDGTDSSPEMLRSLHCPIISLRLRSLKSPRVFAAAYRFVRFLRRNRVHIVQVHHADPSYFGLPLSLLAGVKRRVQTKYDTGFWMNGADRMAHRLLGRLCEVTVANCQANREAAISQGISASRVQVILNGIDLNLFEMIAPLAVERMARQPRIGLLADLRPVKDPATFLHAAALVHQRLPDAEFIIGGTGSLYDHLQQLRTKLGLQDCVQLPGFVQDPASFWSNVDMAVCCSYSEGLSHSLIEAMAAGRVVIATDVGGNRELADDGRRAKLIPVGDPAALANSIISLTEDTDYCCYLADNARAYASRQFGVEQMVGRFEQLYCDKRELLP